MHGGRLKGDMGMNELLRISFKKMGYDYDHLTDISKSRYGPGYLFKGETELCLALKDIRLHVRPASHDGINVVLLKSVTVVRDRLVQAHAKPQQRQTRKQNRPG